VLCVDDDKIIQFTTQRAFVICGFVTDMAYDGLQAIDLVRHSFLKYDFILMDIHMPNMDGIEAAKIIRSIRNYENVPIFALTGDMTMEAKLKVVSSGMNDYFPKPVDMDVVLETMKNYI
jgi:CheY-like chemotaxis protein